jgi:signal transduction histidine kinase
MVAVAITRPRVSQRWVFMVTVAFFYTATVLRAVLENENGDRVFALGLLAVWLVLLLTEPTLTRLWRPYFAVCVGLEAFVVAALLPLSGGSDYFAILLTVPCMQAAQRWGPRATAVLIGLFAMLTGLQLMGGYGVAKALGMVAVYIAADALLAVVALTAQRATEARSRNEALVGELREANSRLVEYARRAEQLAAARERQRLARELHDSVTQTLFGMTLAARSALLLLPRDPEEVKTQLDQIEHLAHDALAEMEALSAELPPPPVAEGDLVAGLRHHLADRRTQEGLSVSLEVEGDERLPPDHDQALLRIVQEALNNVVKHAGTSRAVVRLTLRRPRRVEIEDQGRGFDPGAAGGRGMGLGSMRERADEIGWRLTVISSPDSGTRIVAEEMPEQGGVDHGGE